MRTLKNTMFTFCSLSLSKLILAYLLIDDTEAIDRMDILMYKIFLEDLRGKLIVPRNWYQRFFVTHFLMWIDKELSNLTILLQLKITDIGIIG